MPVHLYAPRRPAVDRPLVLLSGGVDTGKVELHRLACLLAGVGRFRVAAVDMPGTSESGLRLSADAHRVYQGLLGVLAPTGRRAMVGVSFGGHWAAKLALMGGVDAAVNLGGPTVVFESGGDFMRALPNGMPGIIANALGLSSMPDDAEIAALMQPFSLRGLSQHALGGGAAVLTINGDQDQYIPQEDSMLFAGHAHHPVWLMRGMGHCAAEGLVRILPALVAWLRLRMFGETAGARVALSMAQGILPARAVLTRGARR